MKQFFHLFLNDRKWFLGTLIALAILYNLCWMQFNPETFYDYWHEVSALIKFCFQCAIAIGIVIWVVKNILFGPKGKKGGH